MITPNEVVNNRVLIDSFPLVGTMPNNTYLGSFRWTHKGKDSEFSLIPKEYALGKDNMTAGELVRSYLNDNYEWPRRDKLSDDELSAWMRANPQPIRAFIGHYKEAVYVDLKSFYLEAVKRVGVQPAYSPTKNRILGRGYFAPFEDAEIHKPVRAVLVTAGIGRKYRVWRGGEIKTYPTPKLFRNSQLYMAVIHELRGIAELADISGGCVYAMTDGFIFSRPKKAEIFMYFLRQYGWPYKVKAQGETWVYGVGSYRIGDVITKRRTGFMQFNNF